DLKGYVWNFVPCQRIIIITFTNFRKSKEVFHLNVRFNAFFLGGFAGNPVKFLDSQFQRTEIVVRIQETVQVYKSLHRSFTKGLRRADYNRSAIILHGTGKNL